VSPIEISPEEREKKERKKEKREEKIMDSGPFRSLVSLRRRISREIRISASRAAPPFIAGWLSARKCDSRGISRRDRCAAAAVLRAGRPRAFRRKISSFSPKVFADYAAADARAR